MQTLTHLHISLWWVWDYSDNSNGDGNFMKDCVFDIDLITRTSDIISFYHYGTFLLELQNIPMMKFDSEFLAAFCSWFSIFTNDFLDSTNINLKFRFACLLSISFQFLLCPPTEWISEQAEPFLMFLWSVGMSSLWKMEMLVHFLKYVTFSKSKHIYLFICHTIWWKICQFYYFNQLLLLMILLSKLRLKIELTSC